MSSTSTTVVVRRSNTFSDQRVQEYNNMRDNDQLYDFQLVTGEHSIKCHRMVLASGSPVFKAMLQSKMKEDQKNEAEFNNIPYDILKIIIDYLYSGETEIQATQLKEVISACNFLQVDTLKAVCLKHVPSNLCATNVVGWSFFADQLELPMIVSKCKELIESQFSDVISQGEFLNLSLEEVITFLTTSSCRDNDLVDAVFRWINHDRQNRKSGIKRMAQHIDFAKCDIDRLSKIVDRYEVLFEESGKTVILMLRAVIGRIQQKLVVAAGQIIQQLWILDKENGRFCSFSEVPNNARCEWQSICEAPGGFILSGGNGSRKCLMFLVRSKVWISLPNSLYERYAHGSVCTKGLLFVIGGCVKGLLSSSVCGDSEYLNLESGQWYTGPSVNSPLNFPRVVKHEDSIFMLCQDTRKLYHLDPQKQIMVWNSKARVPGDGKLDKCSFTSSKDKLLVVDGSNNNCGFYTPRNDTWTTQMPPIVVHKFGGAVYHQDKFIVLGGEDTDAVESYDAEENVWKLMDVTLSFKQSNLHVFLCDVDV